jgi:hypothetical protein
VKVSISELFSGKITEQTIQNLINEGVEEFKHLDYKSELKLNTDREKKEFARDVSAFANSGGGILIFGVREEGHRPVEIVGIDLRDISKEKMENVILSCISPKISKQIVPVTLAEANRQVFVIIIDQSTNAPHMVIKDKDNRYYKRYDFSSILMDEYEVRYLFERGNQMLRGVENLLIKKNYGLLDPNNNNETWLTLLAIPMALEMDMINISDSSMRGWLDPNQRRYLTTSHSLLPGFARPCLDGFILETRSRRDDIERERFMIVGREGYVQYSSKLWLSQRTEGESAPFYIGGVRLTDIVIEFLKFSSDMHIKTNYYGKVKFMLSINNLPSRTALFTGPNAFPAIIGIEHTYNEKTLQIMREKQLIEIVESSNLVAKDIMDQFYNAFGLERCQRIDVDGSLKEFNWCPLGEGYH